MKTKIYSLLFLMMLAFTFNANAATHPADALKDPVKKPLPDEEIARRMAEMRNRVEQIKALDRSSLSKEERKALRKELRDMNKEARAFGERGVYLSVGAIIIIILLLILIL